MDARTRRGEGWIAFSVAVLLIGGVFAIIDGLVAVYRARFFSSSAVYVFSDLKTWAGSSLASGSPPWSRALPWPAAAVGPLAGGRRRRPER